MYGLKQSGLLWNDQLVEKLVTVHGLEQCTTDPCVFYLIREGKVELILTVHVDDMAVAGTGVEVDKLLVTLNTDFTKNNLGEPSFFTGCSIIQDIENGVLKLDQKPFIETLAKRFDVTTTARYPVFPSANVGPRMKSESGGTWPYREAVGSLMWVVVWSKPEIYNATRVVARHVDDLSKRHWQAVLRSIKYALGAKHQSLTFERGPNLNLSVYTDVNYAEKADDRGSVSGVAVTVGS